MRSRGVVFLVLIGLALLLLVPSAAGYYTDWLWFKELGYESVFLRTLNAQALVFASGFAAAFIFLYANFRLARRTLARPKYVLGTGSNGRPIVIEGRAIAGLAMPIALAVALTVGIAAASNWLDWLSFFNATPFGSVDPIFGRDVSFYVFRLPIYQLVRDHALVLSFLALVGCGLLYVLSGSFVLEPRFGVAFWPRLRLVTHARRHLALLGALIFLILAWGAWLSMASTLFNPTAVGYGPAYTDVYARLPFLRVSIVVLLLGAALCVWHGFGKRGWMVPVAVGLYLATTLTGGIYAAALQNFVVTPNEQSREQPFIAHNIAATRRAYDLDKVESHELSGDASLTAQSIINNAGTIENVRLWDHQPLLQTFGQIQEIRTYYDFVSVDNDRYVIDGKSRQVMLSARELNSESLPTRSWVNEHLTFTHGYGLTLGPVNQVTSEGLPVLFIRDLPPVSIPELQVTEPSIYFGELTKGYALVKTNTPEFHYPKVPENVTSVYQGTGGVPVGGFFRRLIFALRFATTDILVTGQINKDSRIMYHRQISERVQEIAPFLKFDPDPYPVLHEGRLFWIQDAYTETANYPYSTPSGSFNYIRNSVKIVIDAYNGTTTFYLAETRDPLAVTLGKIFPGLLRPLDEMPAGLRQHVRYPEEIFGVQARMFATYHMTNTNEFYSKEDQWQVPALDTERNATPMQPYYTIMKLPGETKAEFIQMLPFTPRAKENLSAWLVAQSDAPHYGNMRVFQFPKQKIVYGPRQIVGRINQDQTISPQITLWNQLGSEVIWGTLLVIPIEESLLYVRPLYLRSPQGKIPELKRVIVAYQSQIVMAETLTQALVQIFGRSIAAALPPDRAEQTMGPVGSTLQTGTTAPLATPTVTADPTVVELAAQSKAIYDRMTKAQKDGDWALYGEELKKLGDVLDKLSKIKK